MTTPAAAPQDFWTRLAHQAEVTFRSASTWVAAAIAAIGLAALSSDQVLALLNSLPFLKGYGAVLTPLAMILIARLKPPTTMSTQTQALIAEVARLRLNVALKAAGQAEIPAPPSAAALPVVVPVPATAPAVDVVIPAAPPAPAPLDQAPAANIIAALAADPLVAELQARVPVADPVLVERVVAALRSSRRS